LLRDTKIRRRSYVYALRDAANDNGFVFLDPPYEGFAEDMYKVGAFDFDRFAADCHAVKGKCQMMITLNDSPAIRERFKGYNIITRGVYYSMSETTKGELIICNYELPHQDYYLNQLGFQLVA